MSASHAFDWPNPAFAREPLLVTGSEVLSHAEVAAAALGIAESLPEGRALVVADASIGCMLTVIACWLRGAMAVIVDGREPATVISEIGVQAGATRVTPVPRPRAGHHAGPIALPLDAHAVALRTSGSTSKPKLAVHRLSSLVANARASNVRTPFGPGDRWLLSLSPHHIGGLSVLVRAMVGGGAVVLGRGPGAVVSDLLDDRRVTHCSVVGAQLRRVLDDPAAATRAAWLKAMLLGGGPAPATWRHEAVRRGIALRATYGLTECASQVATGIATIDDEANDAGSPLDGVGVRISDSGEIHVGGAIVFAGYLDGAAVRDVRDGAGYFATGDLGRVDGHGHLHVLGRKDAMFISGGENIRPEEIENVLGEVIGIRSACVVPIEDERWQFRPVAFVAGLFDAARVESALAANLPRFKWPEHIFALPDSQTARAKPERATLIALAKSGNVAPLWSLRRGAG